MEALRAYVLGAAFVAATAYPGWLSPDEDGYPLSTYPMFSRDRGTETVVSAAFAVDGRGNELSLAPRYIANSEAMQAVRTLNHATQSRRRARRLCRDIARRVADSGDPALANAVEVVLARQRIASVAFLAGKQDATATRKVRARCAIRQPDDTP